MNELLIIYQTRKVKASKDNRYRFFVSMIRADRPRYWTYLCHNCGSKIVDIQNLEVYAETDFYDPQNINNTGIGRHCKGLLPNELPCPYTYFFNVQ